MGPANQLTTEVENSILKVGFYVYMEYWWDKISECLSVKPYRKIVIVPAFSFQIFVSSCRENLIITNLVE